MKFVELIEAFLGFAKRLQFAYLFFIFIIVLLEIFLSYNSQIFVFSKPNFNSSFKNEIAEFKANLISKNEKKGKLFSHNKAHEYFYFNPNTVSKSELCKLGLSEKQAVSVLNYRKSGGKFYTKNDFSKMYCINEQQFESLKPYINLPNKIEYPNHKNKEIEKTKIIELFDFDPNTTSRKDFKRLGLSDKQINTIDKYLSKGGKFREKSDFRKLYVISKEQYQMLYPYIKIEKLFVNEQFKPETQNFKKKASVAELNSATEEELINIRGIGKFSAKKIIEYRKKLGGFVRIEQLREVYGVYENSYLKAKEYLKIDKSKVKKININYADFKELISHPYLEKEYVEKILKYRRKKGKFTNLNQLVEKNILPRTLFSMLKPYLKI